MIIEDVFVAVSLFLFGACFGSFANVVIYRMPRGESVVKPGSYCRSCGAPVKWYHNVPILAWFLLRGRCANCGKKFSIRYAIVELIMASLFMATYFAVGLTWSLLENLVFVFMVVTASVIDMDHMILPDKFTLTGIAFGVIGAVFNPERDVLPALIGIVMGGGFLWAVAEAYYRLRGVDGMGGGDIKLLAWIGALYGWASIPVVIILSSVVGSIVGLVVAARTKDGLRVAIPFGPYLAAAALVYMLFDGASWARWYLDLHGL